MNKLTLFGITLMLLTGCIDGDGSWAHILTVIGIFCVSGVMMVAGMSMRPVRKARLRKSGSLQQIHTLANDQRRDGQAPAGKVGGMERRYRV